MFERMLALDAGLSKRFQIAERPGILRSIAAILAHSGDSWVWVLGLVSLWFLGPAEWKSKEILLLVSILIMALIVMVIKLIFRRQRPEGEWGGIYRKTDPHSFPSGHAARASMLAILGIAIGPIWFGLILIGWAILVILSRVLMGVHYLSDVIAGTLLGVIVGLVILLVL